MPATAPGGLRRLDLGWFVRPGSETGDGRPRVEPALAYLVRHGGELLLFDTGIGTADPETDAHYRPLRRPLRAALAAAGVTPADVTMAAAARFARARVVRPVVGVLRPGSSAVASATMEG